MPFSRLVNFLIFIVKASGQRVTHSYTEIKDVIQVADTGMALLHHSRKEQAVTDGICYKIDI
ncbi:hypothetical protein wHmcTK_04240 [Wolbachia pipientis]|nr:hypothetical protein wHmt_04320 [Wolbachia pipientis]BDG77339.1 hypothetical protein wHmc_04710 [Wolbachia pipientis]